jgi:hypothetical protein
LQILISPPNEPNFEYILGNNGSGISIGTQPNDNDDEEEKK